VRGGHQNPRTTAVTFILASHRLVTCVMTRRKPFMLVENKLARYCPPGITGEMVLMELLDAVIDRTPTFWSAPAATWTPSATPFSSRGHGAHRPRQAIFDILIAIGRKGDSPPRCERAWSRSGGW